MKVGSHDANVIRRSHLLELLAWRSLVAGKMMNGADGDSPGLSGWICLEEEMRAFLPGGLEDHALGITKIDAAVLADAIRIDHEDIKVKAASSAAQADHAA